MSDLDLTKDLIHNDSNFSKNSLAAPSSSRVTGVSRKPTISTTRSGKSTAIDTLTTSFNGSLLNSFASLNIGNDSLCNKSVTTSMSAPPAKTPCKTPGKKGNLKLERTPGSAMKNLKTPSKSPSNGPDRYIPNRNAMNPEINQYLLTHGDKSTKENDGEPAKDTTLSQSSNQKAISDALNCDISNHRILCFNDKAPVAPEGHANNLKVLYSSSKVSSSCKKSSRHIPTQPERILDAPEIKNDYYLQLLDWNSNNLLAVALDKDLYLWNASNGTINRLVELP